VVKSLKDRLHNQFNSPSRRRAPGPAPAGRARGLRGLGRPGHANSVLSAADRWWRARAGPHHRHVLDYYDEFYWDGFRRPFDRARSPGSAFGPVLEGGHGTVQTHRPASTSSSARRSRCCPRRGARPAGGLATITAVETSPELDHAKVYITALGDEEEKEEALAGLRSAAPFIRGQLGRRLHMRRVPELHFEIDRVLEEASASSAAAGGAADGPATPKPARMTRRARASQAGMA
jgi:ribosome-binding factor A